jgi:nicotinamidase-related amidase
MESSNDQTAILLIDLHRDFLEASGRMPVAPEDAEAVVTIANRVLAHAQRVGWLAVFIKNEFSPNDLLGTTCWGTFFAAARRSPGAVVQRSIQG